MEPLDLTRIRQAAERYAAADAPGTEPPVEAAVDFADIQDGRFEALIDRPVLNIPIGPPPLPDRPKTRRGQVTARRKHLEEVSTKEKAKATVFEAEARRPSIAGDRKQADTVAALARERIIGSNDLVDINYLELAISVSRAVARILIDSSAGTGSLVGSRILLTNNHVIGSPTVARKAQAQFDYQENSFGDLLPVQSFSLDPDAFFLTDPDLDFTLVAVAPQSKKGRPLNSYPWLPLLDNPGRSEKDDPINIIQHPRGGLKQIALRNNLIIDIPDTGKPAFLFYTTDTEPGSSGSPCFNDQWELVALHHSGVPRMASGKILRKDGKPFREGVDDPLTIDWIANEGARISAIVAALKTVPVQPHEAALRDSLFKDKPPNPIELARATRPGEGSQNPMNSNQNVNVTVPATSAPGSAGSVSVTIPLTITVSLGNPAAPLQPAAEPPVARTTETPEAGTSANQEAVVIDKDWANRPGYDPKFLEGHTVPFPVLSEEMKKITAVVPAEFRKGSDKFNFPYHHYSVAMNKKRRFAWYSIANIDGGHRPEIPSRGKDKWFIDPRIDPDKDNLTIQCGEELYKGDSTDRGHLTRYLDVAWGKDAAEATRATNDTFHFSNCCLQLSGFNQGKDRWQGIEQFLLENKARKEKRKIIVITGPIFKKTDNVYRNPSMDYSVRIPLSFWKVCVIERADGTLSATGFVLDQDDIVELPGFEEKFDVLPTQVALANLEKRTGLDFGALKNADHFAAGGNPGTLEISSFYENIVV